MLPSLLLIAAAALSAAQDQRHTLAMKSIEEAVQSFEGRAGVYARNLVTGREFAVNPDERFPTASTIKTAVMLEVYFQAHEGRLSLDETARLTDDIKVGGSGVLNGLAAGLQLKLRDLVHLMIVLSDNTATNMLVERVGTQRIDGRLERLGFTSTKIFRPTFRDGRPDVHPDLEKTFGLGMSTPREMAQLMALIAEGKAVDAQASRGMLETLRRQQDRAGIPRLLPNGLQIGNKTGTDSEKLADESGRRGAIRADAAIVEGDGVRYVIAVFTRHGRDTRGSVDNAGILLAAKLARLVHDAWGAR